ncbi:DNA topoisomerase 3-alpha [Orobanche gracilis]
MGQQNQGICFSCRSPKHSLQHCPNEIKCIKCKDGWRTKRVVEANTVNKGKYFYGCSNKQCNYFEWVGEAKEGDKFYHDKGDSSNTKFERSDLRSDENVDELASILEKVAKLAKDQDVDVFVDWYKISIRKM